jgi:hypothetical protein
MIHPEEDWLEPMRQSTERIRQETENLRQQSAALEKINHENSSKLLKHPLSNQQP